MTRERLIPEEELREIDENNKKWLNLYIKNSGKPSRYYDKIDEFLKFCAFNGNKPIQQINKDDVTSYIDRLKKNQAQGQTISFRVTAISSFRTYLITKQNFDEKFLS